jgi:uncharacterized membrane-anchored protein
MMRLLLILVIAGLVALGAAWIADHDAVLTLTVADYEIRTTATVAIAVLLVCFFVLWVALRILFAFLKGLARASGSLSASRKRVPELSRASGGANTVPPGEQTP